MWIKFGFELCVLKIAYNSLISETYNCTKSAVYSQIKTIKDARLQLPIIGRRYNGIIGELNPNNDKEFRLVAPVKRQELEI